MTTDRGIRCPRCAGTGKLHGKIVIADGTVYADDPARLVACPDCIGSGTLDSGASPIFVSHKDDGNWAAMHYGGLEISASSHDRARTIDQVRKALRLERRPAYGEVRDGTGRAV
jgi:hypothetical protein